jgi:V/A-type H+-transporting ATPase subunit A
MKQGNVMSEVDHSTGKVVRIAGPVVAATGLKKVRLFDVVHVGETGLIGEVIRLAGDVTTMQVYEDTSGLKVGEPVLNTSASLVVELGPGLLGSVYDGLQRPLTGLASETGAFLKRGLSVEPLSLEKRWSFTPQVGPGQEVGPGDLLGTVPESQNIEHRLIVPPGVNGRIVAIHSGEFTVDDVVTVLASPVENSQHRLTLRQKWPVRQPRPFQNKLNPNQPLVTGTRIIDTFFPVAKGGNAIIPGGFGTGKTVVEQTLARWADADVVVYIGCGERGNEMAEVLEEFPKLEDPKYGTPLMERTILIANTSNMPVAAREASIYTGVTIAEYYRDMGYDVLLLADSTSRWGEALREISGRLEEMPGEEAYPAYLAARLAEFYERAGRVRCLGLDEQGNGSGRPPRMGSVTIIGAVSPPGGDFSEPMTQNSLRVIGTFWALDYDLSRRRHFPAIDWTRSYTLYKLQHWYADLVAMDWQDMVREAMALLQEEVELLEIVQLVGPDALADEQKLVLAVARMLREDFLQQSAYHEIDRFCPLAKAYWMLRIVLNFGRLATVALAGGVSLDNITGLPIVAEIARAKELPVADAPEQLQALFHEVESEFERVT